MHSGFRGGTLSSVCKTDRHGRGYEIIVDDDNADLALRATGLFKNNRPHTCQVSARGRSRYLHHEILLRRGISWAMVDHVNGNPFDNRFQNLREATHQLNNRNRQARGYSRAGEGWFARVTVSTPSRFAGDPRHEIDRPLIESYGTSVRQVMSPGGKWRFATTLFGPKRNSEVEAREDYLSMKSMYHDGIVGRQP